MTLRFPRAAMHCAADQADPNVVSTPRGGSGSLDPQHDHPRPVGGPVFWLLVWISLATLAACVILPEWRHLQLLTTAKVQQQRRVGFLESTINHQERLLRALRTDPIVIQRLAQRDRFSLGGSGSAMLTSLSMSSLPASIDMRFDDPNQPRSRLEALAAYIPGDVVVAFFCDPQARPILIALSTALLATAFYLFCRLPEMTPCDSEGEPRIVFSPR